MKVVQFEVSVQRGVQPKPFHSLGRGGNARIIPDQPLTLEEFLGARAQVESALRTAVDSELESVLQQCYGKTLKEVC